MRTSTRMMLGLVALSLAVAVGCQRLNEKRTIHVSPGEVQDVIISGPRSEQKINVAVTSNAPIDVYVILSADEQAVKGKLLSSMKPDESKILKKELKTENANLEATIPAKNEFRVLLTGAKKAADVNVHVTTP
jgi:hypothetical protein